MDTPCIKIINFEKLRNIKNRSVYIQDTFNDCSNVENSILIIDGIENIINWINIGSTFNQEAALQIRSTLYKPSGNKKMTVICIGRNEIILEGIGLFEESPTIHRMPLTISHTEVEQSFPEYFTDEMRLEMSYLPSASQDVTNFFICNVYFC